MMTKQCRKTLLTLAALCTAITFISCSELDSSNPDAAHTLKTLKNMLRNTAGGAVKDDPLEIAFDGAASAEEIYELLKDVGKYVCLDLSESSVYSIDSAGSSAQPAGTNMIISLDLPESMTSIEDSAFDGSFGWSNLQEITIPKNVGSIGENAFCGCSNLLGIKIPKNVAAIGSGAFSGCTRLSYIIFRGSNAVIANDTVFPDGESLRKAAAQTEAAGGTSPYKAAKGTYTKNNSRNTWQKN
ncbi:MAG: leucine-rich repeat domain-containing protein [Bacteroides sp.]|nr:leucine-rich repeat domain-containing protein [Prevotella sp.]MCM1408858.1 leucine-rich repeat domain-containing protein [Treponema brennaborense]MCM1470782.1 leucine-rich repeat domain-containing protein [Bacteroides sp.]